MVNQYGAHVKGNLFRDHYKATYNLTHKPREGYSNGGGYHQ